MLFALENGSLKGFCFSLRSTTPEKPTTATTTLHRTRHSLYIVQHHRTARDYGDLLKREYHNTLDIADGSRVRRTSSIQYGERIHFRKP